MSENILEVKSLNKRFENFELKNVSFKLHKGEIIGFIGRNGAGKSTTLNSLLSFVDPDSGEIRLWGMDMDKQSKEVKKKIGFVSAGMTYYMKKNIKTITRVTKSFYDEWDDAVYRHYMEKFGISEEKMPDQLSNGMKIKYSLVLALSHDAELLILDEPTSGLDPVSCDEILEIFKDLADRGKTIFFSTHITSDLEKCADRIIYLKKGRIRIDDSFHNCVNAYRLVEYKPGDIEPELTKLLIGNRTNRRGCSALVQAGDASHFMGMTRSVALDEIIVHLEKED